MRFTLGKLFIAVAMLAIACAGMMYRSYWWTTGIVTFTWLLYLYAGIQVGVLHSARRFANIVFTLVGMSYLLLISGLWGPVFATNIPIAVIAVQGQIGEFNYEYGYHRGVGPIGPPLENVTEAAFSPGNKELHSFFLIGHCVLSWLFAVLAAWFAGRVVTTAKPIS